MKLDDFRRYLEEGGLPRQKIEENISKAEIQVDDNGEIITVKGAAITHFELLIVTLSMIESYKMAKEHHNIISSKIVKARHAAGMTQCQLAAKIGKSQKDISRWECGARKPNLNSRRLLADALNCRIEDLI